MKKDYFNSKGVILVVSLTVMTILLILTGAYFLSTISEKLVLDKEKYNLQALNLAEGGVNHGLSELRRQVRSVLKNRTESSNPNQLRNDLNSYLSSQNPLGLLVDYADFSVSENYIFYTVSPLNFTTGNYTNTTIKLMKDQTQNPNPSNIQEDVYKFFYNYSIEAEGYSYKDRPLKRKVYLSGGRFSVVVQRRNFATFALFTGQQRTPQGSQVWFTWNTKFSGPVHTNDRFNFAGVPAGIFTDEVTQHLTTARFYNNGWTRLLNADSNPPYDIPSFSLGFTRGVEEITLPSSVTQNDLLLQATGNRSPGSFPTNGIYLPNTAGTLDGGIYIRGDASQLNMATDGNNRPTFIIMQGTNTKRITIDYTNNQTIVENIAGSGGTPPGVYNGIPDGVGNEGIIIYGNGDIGNFSGTVQENTKLIVSSDDDIIINNHIRYQDYTPDNPETPENELSASGTNNLLGILAWNGDVRISTSAPNDLEIHGVIMAPRGVFTVDNYNTGSPRGIVTLLGGMITDFYGPFGTFSGSQQLTGYGRNFVYDRRMSEGMSPPYFPYLSGFTSSEADSDGDGIKDLDEREGLIWRAE